MNGRDVTQLGYRQGPIVGLALSTLSHAEPALPDATELDRQGAVVGEVFINAENIFDVEDPEENRSLYRLANRLHIRTQPEVIRQQLLFKSGDRYSQRLLDELASEGKPLKFDVTSAGGNGRVQAVAVQTQLLAYDNIEVGVNTLDPSTYGQTMFGGNFDFGEKKWPSTTRLTRLL